MRLLTKAALAAVLVSTPVLAHHGEMIFKAGPLAVSHLWTEEIGATADAVPVYLTIRNTGAEADTLVAARTDFSSDAKFQAPMLNDAGALAVREIPAIEIGAGQSLTFQQGGVTLVLDEVSRPLRAGEHFEMVLEFEKAGALEVEVEIEPARAHRPEEGEAREQGASS